MPVDESIGAEDDEDNFHSWKQQIKDPNYAPQQWNGSQFNENCAIRGGRKFNCDRRGRFKDISFPFSFHFGSRWSCRINEECWIRSFGFSVKLAYCRLFSLVNHVFHLSDNLKLALKFLWKTNVPSCIQVFVWRLFLYTLQTGDELAKRGVISGPHNLVFPLCLRP
ncbi:unnamed protein product [Vicia faba]|uniref:Reverse transcriptase zinc-binding domain-containing protein n=1 Tax=Vicia faba TaxID=3906 RepID=A0AAV1B6R5_VICFA|nr:unnamed protein product [Vicia faba]